MSKTLVLRKATEADINYIIKLENIHSAFIGTWNFEQHIRAINDLDYAYFIFTNTTNESIGFAILRGINNKNNNFELMRIATTRQNCGHGREAIRLLMHWCFNTSNAHRLWLDVRENNCRAQHVYSALNFVKEGILREAVFDGTRYISLILMSILDYEYKTI